MNLKHSAFKVAFPLTLPVLAGYLMLGMAYGILMSEKGFPFYWTVIMSSVVFAGALQYASITLLVSAFDPLTALILAILVNVRHLFYGIAMLEKFKGLKGKFFMVYGMADEAFSINAAVTPPPQVKPHHFYLWTTGLCYLYWQMAGWIGHLIGGLIPDSIHGFDFVLTALFFVMFLNQWETPTHRKPLIVGVLSTLIALVVFPRAQFLLGAMGFIVIGLFGLERKVRA
jgi:4-azaleucine resistance transporter AzlC